VAPSKRAKRPAFTLQMLVDELSNKEPFGDAQAS
jgi:hypothetical protein